MFLDQVMNEKRYYSLHLNFVRVGKLCESVCIINNLNFKNNTIVNLQIVIQLKESSQFCNCSDSINSYDCIMR
jgi:hypothetical protein